MSVVQGRTAPLLTTAQFALVNPVTLEIPTMDAHQFSTAKPIINVQQAHLVTEESAHPCVPALVIALEISYVSTVFVNQHADIMPPAQIISTA